MKLKLSKHYISCIHEFAEFMLEEYKYNTYMARSFGLCYNWMEWRNRNYPELFLSFDTILSGMMRSTMYPFNVSSAHYDEEKLEKACHLNPKRIEFLYELLKVESAY